MTKRTSIQLALFCILAVIYVSSLLWAYRSAFSLYGGGNPLALGNIYRAWGTESFPWIIACGSVYVLAHFRTKGNIWRLLVPVFMSTLVTIWMTSQPMAYSIDILRYLWDGRLLVHGINPYRYVPIDAHLTMYHKWWSYWSLLGWKDTPEAYPPVAQLYFGVFAWLSNGSVIQYKVLLLFNYIVSLLLFYLVLVEKRYQAIGPPNVVSEYYVHRQFPASIGRYIVGLRLLTHTDIRNFSLFVMFPPLIVESYGSGHVDAFAIPWLLLAWLFKLRDKPIGIGVSLGMAALIKVYPIVLLAAFLDKRDWRRNIKLITITAIVCVLLCLPFLSAGKHLVSFFSHVGSIGYNGSLQHILGKILGDGLNSYSTLIVFAVELVAWVVVFFTRVYEMSFEQKICILGLTFILASPLVHPWYSIPLIPFAIVAADFSVLWFAMTSHLTYDDFPLDMYVEYVPTYALFIGKLAGWNGVRGCRWSRSTFHTFIGK